MYRKYFKRLLDLVLGIPMLLVALPVILLLAGLLFIIQKRAVLFTQIRPGLHAKSFKLYKFKTMSDACAPDGSFLDDAQRLTAIGTFLRKYSLDELPQLWNVCKGELSLVGPRPLLPEYLPLYNPEQAQRHTVKPGLTGWVQINGRNTLAWERKFKYDVWYVRNQSFQLDIKILLLTCIKVLRTTDTQAPGCATAGRFTGTLRHAS